MITIRVCGLAGIEKHRDSGAEHMVSILARGFEAHSIRPDWIDADKHHAFFFADVEHDWHPEAPTLADVERLVALATELAGPGSSGRFLIHCTAGISRSTAAALIFFCVHLGPGEEERAMRLVAESSDSPMVWPNSLMVKYADRVLQRDGRMARAVDKWVQSCGLW
jgi:predicted protein tyrosine phosphatase